MSYRVTPNKYKPHQGVREMERRLPIPPHDYVRQQYFWELSKRRGDSVARSSPSLVE